MDSQSRGLSFAIFWRKNKKLEHHKKKRSYDDNGNPLNPLMRVPEPVDESKEY